MKLQKYWGVLILLIIVENDATNYSSNKKKTEEYLKELQDIQNRLEDLLGSAHVKTSNLKPDLDLHQSEKSNLIHATDRKIGIDNRGKFSKNTKFQEKQDEETIFNSKPNLRNGLSSNGNDLISGGFKNYASQRKVKNNFGQRNKETYENVNQNSDEFESRSQTANDPSISPSELANSDSGEIDGSTDIEQESYQPEEVKAPEETSESDNNVPKPTIGNGGLTWSSSNVELVPLAVGALNSVPPNKTRIQLDLDNYDSFEPVQFQLENDKLKASVNVEPVNHARGTQNAQANGNNGVQLSTNNYNNGIDSGGYQQNNYENQWDYPSSLPNDYYYAPTPAKPPTHHLGRLEKEILRRKFGPSPESSNNPISRVFGKLEEAILPRKYKSLRFPNENSHSHVNHPENESPHEEGRHKRKHKRLLTQKDLAKDFLRNRFRKKKMYRKFHKFN